jgi:hypothetical protein
MRKIEYNVYSFDELSDKAKEKAIESIRNQEHYPHDDWNEGVYESWKEKLNTFGYPDADIRYSGFWSQGDGASFTCKSIDIEKWLELHKAKDRDYPRILRLLKNGNLEVDSARVIRDRWHNYVHENTISAYVNFNMYGRLGTDAKRVMDVLDKVEKAISIEVVELSQQIYSELKSEYDEITSDAAIKEHIEEGDFEFRETGELY